MAKRLNISFDSDLLESISSEFDLRAPNKAALRKLVFTLDGDYSPDVMQVLNLATGVGKTYLMAAFVEYLRCQGIGNVVIVTPGKTVQAKTVANFTPGNLRYIAGSTVPPDVVTPQDYSAWVNRSTGQSNIAYGRDVPVLAFIFNIQQLIAPKSLEGETYGTGQDAVRRKPRRFDENAGVLFDYLKELDDLVVIADESHLYSSSAAAFNAALHELDPAATIGLTASVQPGDNVIYTYPLHQAIKDQYVKTPVLAFRKGGYGADQASEEQQLRDALQLRKIKQTFYDLYAEQNGKAHLNAVAFVVCSDTDHATQVSDLLRTPEYLGSSMAVLQVDSKHDDDTTQYLLEKLDAPESPVLAVVSVNKLKEGWDVKNIAVVVTLRAMASEVLTQQTMGRGLRLPFGKYTDVWQIDQLDIIAHQSFRELLDAEEVLKQFGLEEAVASAEKGKVAAAIRQAAENTGGIQTTTAPQSKTSQNTETQDGRQGYVQPSFGMERSSGAQDEIQNGSQSEAPTVGAMAIGDEGFASNEEISLEYVTIERNPRFADVAYRFPVTEMLLEQQPIDLADISDKAIDEAAKRVTSTGDVLLRKEIVAALGGKLRAIDAESAEVDSIHISNKDAKDALVRLVMNMHLIPSTKNVAEYVSSYLVPKFMKCITFDDWTVKSLDSAQMQLHSLLKEYIDEVQRSAKEVPQIHPREMRLLGYSLPMGERVYEPIDSVEQFKRGRVYSGWFKSLFAEESFDSYSGEYELARLLNTSPHIVWWHRLHPHDQAYIYFNSKDRYFPDFVARDGAGTYWIIEGKDKRGRDDAKVQAKRKAAEKLVRRLAIEEEYVGQTWGYMIAYEDDIAKADSWDDLKVLAQPVSNEV
ncbi:DEAD/DEAH box helicase family protein [Enteroscipio rubneri]|uniref:Restriction endonuclease n=1 Tax=Enteroscipio rubneri TaxID=2070686 RepID=A0A2K2UA46_9ACTN|nr:DEAD/DEAH box helicase family protein [Enteroscipio rubneri]PNV67149.1 restriction endonuclease [Enteroscipio rubneri]